MSPELALLTHTRSRRSTSLPAPFACSLAFGRGGAERVVVAGELDIATAPLLADAVRASQTRAHAVELDLRGIAFMDGSAIQVIVQAAVRAREADERLVVLSTRPDVDRILALTGIPHDVEVRGATAIKARP